MNKFLDQTSVESLTRTAAADGAYSPNKVAQDNLKNLKNKLNLSDEAMAQAIGVSLTRMVVMLYGEPEKIPSRIATKIKVLEALSRARSGGQRAEEQETDTRPTGKRTRIQPMREDQRELLELQKSLGLTHDDLARIAGIPRSRMMTYVYGRTRSIPQAVLESIRQLKQARESGEHPYLFEAVEEMEGSLPEFIAKWQERLGFDKDDHQSIAKAMGISKSTLLRWMDGESGTRPSFVRKCLASLHAYEQAHVPNHSA